MDKPNILLGLTGSVASVLVEKMYKALSEVGNVEIVATESAKHFMGNFSRRVWFDIDEWQWKEADFPSEWSPYKIRNQYKKDDPVVHIDLRNWADIFVIAPLSANTLAKMANGLCDNLLTSVFRAWDWTKPVVVAPAMNTLMWESPFTSRHLDALLGMFGYNFDYVPPQKKMLACGDEGEGAMADIGKIVGRVQHLLTWMFPILTNCPGIPINYHPGAFAFHRVHSHHTGVDLYCPPNQAVYAVEGGTVVNIEPFTGPQDGSPWWNDTDAILVSGRSGVVCYGEVSPSVKVGDKVKRGQMIAHVKTVLLEGKERPDIPGHSRSMLHIELYKKGKHQASKSWKHGEPIHDYMTDPTPLLCAAIGAPTTRLIWENPEKES